MVRANSSSCQVEPISTHLTKLTSFSEWSRQLLNEHQTSSILIEALLARLSPSEPQIAEFFRQALANLRQPGSSCSLLSSLISLPVSQPVLKAMDAHYSQRSSTPTRRPNLPPPPPNTVQTTPPPPTWTPNKIVSAPRIAQGQGGQGLAQSGRQSVRSAEMVRELS